MSNARRWNVYKRVLKNGPVYYARFRMSDGNFGPARSTGQKTKARAETWAAAYFEENGAPQQGDRVTLGEFSKGFYDVGGPYWMHRTGLRKRVSEEQVAAKAALLDTYVVPTIGERTPLADIDEIAIDRLRAEMFSKGRAESTVNHALDSLKGILDHAKRAGLIRSRPLVERVGQNYKHRDAFTLAEFQAIFAVTWDDPRALVANLLAAVTGLRAGEIQALRPSSIVGDSLIVAESWKHRERKLGPTKTGKARSAAIPLPAPVNEELERLIRLNPYRDDVENPYIFWADKGDTHPCESVIFRQGLKRAMRAAKIPEAVIKARSLTFHSWRHFANTQFLASGASSLHVKAITGHQTDAMQERYYHPEELADIREAQKKLVGTLQPKNNT